MDGKKAKEKYPRPYVAVAEHYAQYLVSKGYLDANWCIGREKFKSVLEEEYKQKFPIRAHFEHILAALSFVNLIRRKVRSGNKEIHFVRNVLELLLAGKTPETLQKHPDATLAEPKNRRLVDQQFAFRAKRKMTSEIDKLNCLLCKVSLSSDYEVEQHKKTLDHRLRETYRTNRNSFNGKHFYIYTATKSASNKITGGECVVRVGETAKVTVVLSNTDKITCNVSNIYELIPSAEIKLHCSLPIIVEPGKTTQVSVEAHFTEIAAVIYPLIFNVLKNNASLLILHEVIFRVQSEEIDDLSATAPYKRLVSKLLKTTEYPTVSGIPPPSHKNAFSCHVNLREYPIPANLIYIINNGFKVAPEMKENVKKKLQEILGMLRVSPGNGAVSSDMNTNTYTKLMGMLLHMEEHQMMQDIHAFDCEDQIMEWKSNRKLCVLKVPGLAEKRPSVMRNDKILVQIKGDEKHICYEGIVHSVKELEVCLGFSQQFLQKFLPNMKVDVSFSINRYPLRLQHRALSMLERNNMISLMFPSVHGHASTEIINPRSWFNRLIETNKEQQTAVRNILSGCSFPSPYIVFGPPGTGKTVTIVESILQLWKQGGHAHILACAPSNSAADVIAIRLVEHMPTKSVLRIYADCWPGGKIPDVILQSSNYDKKEDSFFFPAVEVIMNKIVVVSTCITAGKLVSAGIPGGHFTHLFVDESGHAPEPELLIPMSGLLTSNLMPGKLLGQIILAGDPQQLGPIVRSTPASMLGLGVSFLERLVVTNELYQRNKETNNFNTAVLTKLVKNFRSHELILKVPNELFYEGKLKACGGDITKKACNWTQLPKKGFPLIFHGVRGRDQRQAHSPSYFNTQEIDIVIRYVAALLEDRLSGYKVQQKDIGIIAPYRLQVQKFQQILKTKNWSDITVGSIEEFQGQEKLIIIISTVRSNVELLESDHKYHLGFLRNPKRFNVAVTRAKALLITVGNPSVLQHDKRWRKFIEFCQENGAYKGCNLDLSTSKESEADEDFIFDFASLNLGGQPNTEDGPQWRADV